MELSEAEDILDDGETNALTSPGVLVSDPSFVVEISKDGELHSMKYGTLGSIDESNLDYLIHRVYNVTLKGQPTAYEDHDFRAKIYHYSDGEVVCTEWVATPDGWEDA